MSFSSCKGIGIDLIDIPRIKASIERQGDVFLRRIFTEKEIAYCSGFTNPYPCYAARFAVKEAVSKALGVGIGGALAWQDIEVLHHESKQPFILLSSEAQERFSNPQLLLSISHTKEQAVAIVLWQES